MEAKHQSNLTLARINEITVQINSSQELHKLLAVIMDAGRDLLLSEGASLLLYDPETEELIFDVARGSKGEELSLKRIPVGEGIAGICAQERRPIIVNDAASDPRIFKGIDQQIQFQTRNLMAVPMMVRERMIGVLEVVNTTDRRDYIKSDLRMLSYLSNMAALAIMNRQLYEDVAERVEELNCIYTISSSTQEAETVDALLDSILSSIEFVLKSARGSVLLRDEHDPEKLNILRTRGFVVDDADRIVDPGQSIAGIVLRSGDPLLVRDLEKDLRMNPVAAERYKTSSFISVPIKQNQTVIGVLNVADKKNGQAFDSFEMKVLTTVAGQLGDAYSRILAREREQEIRNYKKDLETAAMIQMSSLPQIPARLSGMQIATRYEACKAVGGDFYDLIYHSDDRISMVVADVAGKGVPAALFMEFSKTLIAGMIPRHLDPVTTLQQANKSVYKSAHSSMFVTVMLVQVERELRRLRLASAGHNHQLLYRAESDECEMLSARGTPLGILPDANYIEKVVNYTPGDLLLLYTDGLSENSNEAYEEFGEERLFEIVRKHCDADPEKIASVIMDTMKEFRGNMEPIDDATMMLVRL